ncbi:MAG: hypothetical protein ABEL51_02725 [Salinibacter sp.]
MSARRPLPRDTARLHWASTRWLRERLGESLPQGHGDENPEIRPDPMVEM